jgi:hypothetical protein
MFTSFKKYLNYEDMLNLLISNLASDDTTEPGGAESKCILWLMITRVWRHKNINKKNPEAQLHARKET